MTGTPEDPSALVAAELRGYRRFRLTGALLHPTVHSTAGPWSGGRQEAECLAGGAHPAPAPSCGCGLYGWYHPADARADSGGDVTAVIAARGRVVLGESGFRAQAARIEAVAVPRLLVRGDVDDLRRALAECYPDAVLYRSRRRMLRAHPPDDLVALGIAVRPSAASRYRTGALLTWLAGVLTLSSVAVFPRGTVRDAPPAVWLVALVGFLLWQVLLVALAVRSSPGVPRLVGGRPVGGAAPRR